MSLHFRHPFRVLTILIFGAALLLPVCVSAQEREHHVVTSKDLQQEVARSAQARSERLARVEKFFSQAPAKQALEKAHIDYQQVRDAVRMLDDRELENLATRTDKIQSDFAAGALNNQEITYIIIALVTAVIIIVIVVA